MSEDKDKLIDVLRQNDVCISTKGNICLNDLVEIVIQESNNILSAITISDIIDVKFQCNNRSDIEKNIHVNAEDIIDKKNLSRCYKKSSNDIKRAKKLFIHYLNFFSAEYYLIHYQFIKHPCKIISLYDLFYLDFDSDVILIKSNKNKFDTLSELNRFYINISKRYEKHTTLKKIYNNVCCSSECFSMNFKPSQGEQLVIDCLDLLKKQYDIIYFYKFRWPFCKDKGVLEYDFYCILLCDDYLYQFVIEFDGGFHFQRDTDFIDFRTYHVHDILKQYYLFQRSIHLLRLNNKYNIVDQIISFINNVIGSKKYVIINKIEPVFRYFLDKNEHGALKNFNNYYKIMHDKIK